MDLRAIFLGLSFALLWSSAFTSARIIVVAAPPLTALALRFLVSGLVGIAIARALGQSWTLTRTQWRNTIIFGLCQNTIYLGMNFVAMQWVEASVAAIIASSMPLLVGLLGWLLMGQRMTRMGAVGLVIGFVGVGLIMGMRLTGGTDPLGVAMCLAGAAALATATLVVRNAASGSNVLMIVGLQMMVGAVSVAALAIPLESWDIDWSGTLVIAFLYTSLGPGLLATWIWFVLIRRIGAVKAATFHFLNPFFGVAIAAVLLGEHMTLTDVIGVAVIMAGILAVQLSKQQT